MTDEKKQKEEQKTIPLGRGLLAGGLATMMRDMVVGVMMAKLNESTLGGGKKSIKDAIDEIASSHIEMVMEASLQHRPEDVRHLLKQLPTDEARLEYLQKLDACHRCGATPRSSACRGRGDV